MKKRSSETGSDENFESESPKIAGPEYFVNSFAKLDPSDEDFSVEDRLGAFDRAVESAGLSGRVLPNQFDTLYEHYRWEMGLLRHTGKQKK